MCLYQYWFVSISGLTSIYLPLSSASSTLLHSQQWETEGEESIPPGRVTPGISSFSLLHFLSRAPIVSPPPFHHDTAGLREVASHPEQVPLRWGFELMPIKGEKDSFSHNNGFSSQAHMHDHQYFELKCLRRLLASQSHCWSCDQSSEGYWSWRMDLVIAPYRQTYGDVLNRSKSADPEDKDLWTLLSDTSIRKRAGLLCLWKKNWLWVFTRKVLIIWRFCKPDLKSMSY